MTNTYYNPTGAPATQTRGLSVVLREELAAIEDGFDEIETALATNGIVFPATQVPGATANTLDDYEEGLAPNSWTPVESSGNGLTLTNVSGQYVKIGRLVFVQCQFTYPVNTVSPVIAAVGGLPFSNGGSAAASLAVGQIQGGTSPYTEISLDSAFFLFLNKTAGRASPIHLSGLTYFISGCYAASA